MKRVLYFFLLSGIFGAGLTEGNAQQSFSEWKQQQERGFQQYKADTDKAFSDFLRQEWEAFSAFKAMEFDPGPKPLSAPRTDTGPVNDASLSFGQEEISVPAQESPGYSFSFFGSEMFMKDPGPPHLRITAPLNSGVFSKAWEILSSWNYESAAADLLTIRKKAELNDWGYFLLVNSAAEKIAAGSDAERNVLSWFLLVKSGIDCRLGYSGDRVFLLVPSTDRIYNVMYFYFNREGPYYYFFNGNKPVSSVGRFYTYNGQNPGNVQPIRMKVARTPKVLNQVSKRILRFSYKRKAYEITADINTNVVALGRYYPQTDIPLYFESPAAPETLRSLIGAFKGIVSGMPQTEAANLLLRFVQTAFQYETDQQQFGYEKPMFIEETLFYPSCDCEDRSILYAYLVRQVLGLDVIGLDYPGHIATAVAFNPAVPGDAVLYQGKRYTVCDPTFINADIGMAMPMYENTNPSIITIE